MTWERMKAAGRDEHGTVFEETAEHCGTAITRTPIGTIVLKFEFDAAAECITYEIAKRPMMAPSTLIWGGIEIRHQSVPQRLTEAGRGHLPAHAWADKPAPTDREEKSVHAGA